MTFDSRATTMGMNKLGVVSHTNDKISNLDEKVEYL